MANQYVCQFMRPGYEPGDGSMDGAMLVDGEWWHPMFGCDSLQHVLDGVRYRRVLLETPGKTGDGSDDLIEAVEVIRRNPDDCKDYEDNYRTGWWDACNTVLELLHARLTHDRPPSGKDFDR